MANIKSQKKRIKTNAKATDRNRAIKSEMRQRIRTALATVGTDEQDEAVRRAVKRIDSAAEKGAIHKNAAARHKSRLMKRVNAAQS